MNGPARDEIEKDQHFHAPCSNIIYYHAHLFAILLHRNDSKDDVHKILTLTKAMLKHLIICPIEPIPAN